jgi:hypothetical protein
MAGAGQQRAPGAWQPIETAPKDGTPVLVARVGGNWSDEWPEIASWMKDGYGPGYWTNGAHDGYGDAEPPLEPTHWMPLPAMPNVQAKGAGNAEQA